MKQQILLSSIATVLLFALSGCGGGGDNETNIEDVTLTFKTDAAYDLSEYVYPTTEQTNNYVENEYVNESGKLSFDSTPDDTTYSAYSYEINGTTVTEYDGADLSSTMTIGTDRLTIEDVEDGETTTETIVRHADEGDYIIKSIESGIGYENTMLCKLSDFLSSLTVNGNAYSNVAKVTCEYDSTSSVTLNGTAYTSTYDGTSTIYLANGIGMISETDSGCQTDTVGTATSKECYKETSEITTINY